MIIWRKKYIVLRFSDKDVLTDIKNVIRTIAYEINLILPPPEGDKLLGNDGNDNELSASDLMSVSELSVAVSPKVIIIKNFLNNIKIPFDLHKN